MLPTQQRSFYITVGSFASALILYRLSKSNQDSGSESWISGLISKYTPSQEEFEKRNAIHTALLEKAASDRHLFQSQGPSEAYELRQPEYVIRKLIFGDSDVGTDYLSQHAELACAIQRFPRLPG